MRRMHVLETTERGREYQDRLNAFMNEFVYPAESVYAEQMAATEIGRASCRERV